MDTEEAHLIIIMQLLIFVMMQNDANDFTHKFVADKNSFISNSTAMEPYSTILFTYINLQIPYVHDVYSFVVLLRDTCIMHTQRR